MHLLESSLFRDQITACGTGDLCYVRNDHFDKVRLSITFEAWECNNAIPRRTHIYENEIEAGSIDWFSLPVNFTSHIQVILVRLKVYNHPFTSAYALISESVYLKDMPKNIKGLHSLVEISIVDIRLTKNGDAEIVLESDKLALFVYLTTRAQGFFVHNCVTLRPFEKNVSKNEEIRSSPKIHSLLFLSLKTISDR